MLKHSHHQTMDATPNPITTTDNKDEPIILDGQVENPEHPLYNFLQSRRRILGIKECIHQRFLKFMPDPVVAMYLSSERVFLYHAVKTTKMQP